MNLYEQERATTSQLRTELQTLQGQVTEARALVERLQTAADQAEAERQHAAELSEQLEAKVGADVQPSHSCACMDVDVRTRA